MSDDDQPKPAAIPPLRCPECADGRLTEQTNHKNGSKFLACDNWISSSPPRGCQYTSPITAFVHMIRSGAPKLPGF